MCSPPPFSSANFLCDGTMHGLFPRVSILDFQDVPQTAVDTDLQLAGWCAADKPLRINMECYNTFEYISGMHD